MATPVTVVQAYFDAMNKGDADAAADTFTPDGALMADEFETLAGREMIRGALRGMMQDLKVVATPEIKEVREDGQWAFAQTSSTGTLQIMSAGITRPADHRELFVLKNTADGWRIAYYMFNDSMGLPE
jgi:uncharacterized protein (TIGR02246 family)